MYVVLRYGTDSAKTRQWHRDWGFQFRRNFGHGRFKPESQQGLGPVGRWEGTFGPKTDLSLTGPPQQIIAGDFNRDGKLDLVLPIQAANAVALLTGNGLGGFGAPKLIPVDGGPFMPFLSDFNVDGKPDLAVTMTTRTIGSRRVAVMLGDGSGGFGMPTYLGSFANDPLALGTADCDRDGKPDLAVGAGTNTPSDGSNNLTIFLSDGRGG